MNPDRIVSPDSLGRALLEIATRAAEGRSVDDLDRVPLLGRHGRLDADSRAGAVAADAHHGAMAGGDVKGLDPEQIAEWVTGHYRDGPYPAVVLGSAHGGAVHLAAAMGAPWLPAAFTVSVRGAATTVDAPAGVSAWRTGEPDGSGTACYVLRWRRLPDAYRKFLATKLTPDAGCLMVRDVRPAAGAVEPGFDAGVDDMGTRRILYTDPHALSAAVADVYRELLGGDHCVVEGERLLDPWGVLTRRQVPYWCETSSHEAAEAAELWLAGSRPFEAVTVMPQPPGTTTGAHAGLLMWRSVSQFATRRGEVDRQVARRYPGLPLPIRQAVRPGRTPARPVERLPLSRVVAALNARTPERGLIVL